MEITQQAPDSEKISVHSKTVDVLSRVTPSMMKEAQDEDVDISQDNMLHVKSVRKPMLASNKKN